MLPRGLYARIGEVTQAALMKALDVAVNTLEKKNVERPANFWHKGVVAATGAVGGFFGLTALALELPVSTTLMLRSIADIARSQGEDIADPPYQACLFGSFCPWGKERT